MKNFIISLSLLLATSLCCYSQSVKYDRFHYGFFMKSNLDDDLMVSYKYDKKNTTLSYTLTNISEKTLIIRRNWIQEEPSVLLIYGTSEIGDTVYYRSCSILNNLYEQPAAKLLPKQTLEDSLFLEPNSMDMDENKINQLLINQRISYSKLSDEEITWRYKFSSFVIKSPFPVKQPKVKPDE